MKKLVVAFLLIASTAAAQLAPRGPGIRVVSPLDCEAVLACGGSEPFPTVCPDQDCAEPNNFMTWNADLGCFECGPAGTEICVGSVCEPGDFVVWNVDEACLECSGAPPSTELWSSGAFGIYHNTAGVVVGDGNDPWCAADGGPGDLRVEDDLEMAGVDGDAFIRYCNGLSIISNTIDSFDDQQVLLSGGGGASPSRGAIIVARGNENATSPGQIFINSGQVANSSIIIANDFIPSTGNVIVRNDAGGVIDSRLVLSPTGAVLEVDGPGDAVEMRAVDIASGPVLLTQEDGATDNSVEVGTAGVTIAGNATDDVLIADPLNLYLNSSRAETICNAGFTMPSGSAFLAGQLGVEGNVFTDNGFIAGCGTTTFSEGRILHEDGANSTELIFDTPTGANVATIRNITGDVTVLGQTIPSTAGGTGIDTSASTGIPSISAGTWSVGSLAGAESATRLMASNVNQGATTIASVGHVGQTVNTPASGAIANADGASGAALQFQTGATGTSWGGITDDIPVRRDWDPDSTWYVSTGNAITDTRLWVGSFSADPHASATPAGSYAGFRYDTATDGTAFWRACTDDAGAAPTCATTTVAVATSTFYTMRIVQSSADVKFYVNGALVATNTTNLPVATTVQTGNVTVMELAAAATRFLFSFAQTRCQ